LTSHGLPVLGPAAAFVNGSTMNAPITTAAGPTHLRKTRTGVLVHPSLIPILPSRGL
jgi:hypothetical protein